MAATRLPSAPRCVVGAHRDRDHRLEHELVGLDAAAAQEAPERAATTADSTTSLTVPPSAFLIALKRAELGVDPRVAPVRADRHVERARRRRAEPGPRHRADADEPLARLPERPARGARGARAGRGRPRPAPSRARAAPRRAARRRSAPGAGPTSRRLGRRRRRRRARSNSTVVMSTPETPSTSAWWVFEIIAKRSPLERPRRARAPTAAWCGRAAGRTAGRRGCAAARRSRARAARCGARGSAALKCGSSTHTGRPWPSGTYASCWR